MAPHHCSICSAAMSADDGHRECPDCLGAVHVLEDVDNPCSAAVDLSKGERLRRANAQEGRAERRRSPRRSPRSRHGGQVVLAAVVNHVRILEVWLGQTSLPEAIRTELLNLPVAPGHVFNPETQAMLDLTERAAASREAVQRCCEFLVEFETSFTAGTASSETLSLSIRHGVRVQPDPSVPVEEVLLAVGDRCCEFLVEFETSFTAGTASSETLSLSIRHGVRVQPDPSVPVEEVLLAVGDRSLVEDRTPADRQWSGQLRQ
ncbi:unnamed protein product [Gadus morhua 'NCC']